MIIERDNNKIVIKMDGSIDMKPVQKLIDYLNLMESVRKNKGTEEQATELARESEKQWWIENKHRFSK